MNLTSIKYLFLAEFIFCMVLSEGHAKSSIASVNLPKPEIGKPCPEFTLSHVTHYPKKQVTLSDFKGQWLFLDFWFTGCSSCINSFSKISDLQAEFVGKVQFLLVGHNGIRNSGGGKNIVQVFEKLRANQQLTIASAYDSVLAIRWGVKSMPHIVIVDPHGIVRFITDGRDITKEKIRGILNGEPVSLFEKEETARPYFQGLLAGPDGDDFPQNKILNQSLITKWNGETPFPGYDLSEYVTFPSTEWQKGFKISGVPLGWLYAVAYLGKSPGYLKYWKEPLYAKVYALPVLELVNPKPFEHKYDGSDSLYNYLLRVPSEKVTKENLMKFMQEDLKRTFGQYHAIVEERDMPVWKLIAKPGAEERIKTKGGPPYYDGWKEKSTVAGFTVRNIPMADYIKYLCYYLNEKEKHPFIDATGIKYNIDLTIDADLTNIEDVRKALQEAGLDLVKGTKMMKVLVITDN